MEEVPEYSLPAHLHLQEGHLWGREGRHSPGQQDKCQACGVPYPLRLYSLVHSSLGKATWVALRGSSNRKTDLWLRRGGGGEWEGVVGRASFIDGLISY